MPNGRRCVYPVIFLTKVSKNSRPSFVVEAVARVLRFFAGSLPLARAVRGNVSDDPRVEEDFFADRKWEVCKISDE
jgi:acylglycerol lipase